MQMHKYFEDQFDDEEVLMVFRHHPIVMRKGLILSSIGVLIGPLYILAMTFIYANNPERFPTMPTFYLAMLASFALGAVLFFPSWLAWFYSVFIVSDQRFIQITQKGLFHRSVVDIGLNQVQMVSYEIGGLQETMLGYGTLQLQTFVGELVIKDVHHPNKVQKDLLAILRDQGITSSAGPNQAHREEEPSEA
jgi:signal transduction histidine kinase